MTLSTSVSVFTRAAPSTRSGGNSPAEGRAFKAASLDAMDVRILSSSLAETKGTSHSIFESDPVLGVLPSTRT